MTEEQRQAALEAIDRLEEEAIERGSNPQMTGNEALDLFERGDFAKIIKAAHAYAELQKGEQK